MKTAIWNTDTAYRILKLYSCACIRTCFRRMKFSGKENIPSDAAVIIASNHCCTMIDPMVMLCRSKEPTSYGARADVFRKPKVARFLRFLKMVPLARMQDGLSAVQANTTVFDEVVEVIEHGITFCLFPEGRHFPGYEVHHLKTGAARIALLAASRGEKPVYIVPAGLSYSGFYEFMSDVEVRFGEPIQVVEGNEAHSITAELEIRIRNLVKEPVRDGECSCLLAGKALAVVTFPIFVLCAVLSSPILLLSALLSRKLKDRAWINTIRFGCRFYFFPLWPFHSLFFLLLRLYRRVF